MDGNCLLMISARIFFFTALRSNVIFTTNNNVRQNNEYLHIEQRDNIFFTMTSIYNIVSMIFSIIYTILNEINQEHT